MSRRNARRSAEEDRAGRPGFTLIEVLVVVAIIALLIAILLPALTAARNEAQAALCLSNLKQVSNGVQIHQVEQGMKRERIGTNYGWATYSFRANKNAGKLFACPTDPSPRPVPALFADIYDNTGAYQGRVASDGVFNTVADVGGNKYTLDIQDSVNYKWLGRDAGTGDVDLVLSYSAEKGAVATTVTVKTVESAWNFKVFDAGGRLIWDNPRGAKNGYTVPLMWLSYGANATAGLRSTKGNPILIVENKNPGVFPENFKVRGGRPGDELRQVLRLRHGSRLVKKDYNNKYYGDPSDKTYQPRDRADAAFLDGHAERLNHAQILAPTKQTDDTTGFILWHQNLWVGLRRGNENWFD